MSLPKPLVSWAGGKRRLLKFLLPLVPPHTCYVEAFGGGGALLFAKAPAGVEVYNDINGGLVNLLRQAKWHPDELVRELSLVPNSRELFRLFLDNPGFTEIQRAARFLFRSSLHPRRRYELRGVETGCDADISHGTRSLTRPLAGNRG